MRRICSVAAENYRHRERERERAEREREQRERERERERERDMYWWVTRNKGLMFDLGLGIFASKTTLEVQGFQNKDAPD